MKALSVVCGFMLTLAVFAGGLAFATWLLAAKPARQFTPGSGVADLWTRDARPIDKAALNLERIPGVPSVEPASAATAGAGPAPANPATAEAPARGVPAAIQPVVAGEGQPTTSVDLPVVHVEWCATRYRSYDADDNSYISYSGRPRPCISPYIDDAAVGRAPQSVGYVEASAAQIGDAAPADDGARFSSDHVQNCFSRYHSYRPQDNTYQPYSGGPRRQCQ